MRLHCNVLGTALAACSMAALPCLSHAQRASPQQPVPVASIVAFAELPEAPQPVADLGQNAGAQESGSSSSASTPEQDSSGAEKARRAKAQQQIEEEEHQRVLGIVPAFNTSYRSDAVSLTAREKMSLAFRSAVDPVTFAGAVLVAGIDEANDDYSGFGWGAEGFGKRAGAAYLDAFDGTMLGNGMLPSLLHQDPRYFRLGHGTATHRLLYSAAMTVICKHDNTGRWEPNYSNIGGNILSGALSNLYYPSQDSGVGQTISAGMIVTAEGMVGGIFQEFWPDISRKLFHKDPTHGLDDQAQAAAARGKKEKQPLPAQK